jgi:hypothetical protein
VKKPLPKLQADHEAERFVAEANLTEYGLSRLRTVQFEFQLKKRTPQLASSKAAARCRQKLQPQARAYRISASSDKRSKPPSSARAGGREPPAIWPRPHAA